MKWLKLWLSKWFDTKPDPVLLKAYGEAVARYDAAKSEFQIELNKLKENK